MNIAPTKGNLLALKRQKRLAKTGFDLMDKKRNILIRELMALMDQAADLQNKINTRFDVAYSALRLANISLGGCERIAQTSPIDNSISLKFRSVMGVELPVVAMKREETISIPYGLIDTDSKLDFAYLELEKMKALIRELAGTENAIFRLAYSIKKTQKRANALKNIVIPRINVSIFKIAEELEEKEREEFVRQKVLKARTNS